MTVTLTLTTQQAEQVLQGLTQLPIGVALETFEAVRAQAMSQLTQVVSPPKAKASTEETKVVKLNN